MPLKNKNCYETNKAFKVNMTCSLLASLQHILKEQNVQKIPISIVGHQQKLTSNSTGREGKFVNCEL
jgi:hypothetical protein